MYEKYFVLKNRPDGSVFTKLSDDAPESLRNFVRDVHLDYFDGCLPNDWIYDQIANGFYASADYDDLEDMVNEVEVDPYTSDHKKWLSEPYAIDYCNQYLNEFGAKEFLEILSGGQWLAKRTIYQAVKEFIENEKEAKDA